MIKKEKADSPLPYFFWGISFVFVGMSLYKLFFYENEEGLLGEKVNAYVGGDAYNYIINGTFATAYAVLAILFALWGFWLKNYKKP